jgi:NPCBM/NEW2 domain
MITTLPIFIALVSGQTTRKPEVKLVDLTPVTQVAKSAIFKFSKEFSMGGVVLKEGVLLAPQGDSTPDRGGRLVYSVPKGAQFFRGYFGIPDTDTDGTGEATIDISIDGEPLQEIRVVSGQKPTKFDVNVKGAKSIMLAFSGTAGIGDASFASSSSMTKPPVVTKPMAKPPTQETPPKPTSELGRITLTAPESGDIAKDSVNFKWDSVPDATGYGLEIIMISNADPKKIPSRYLRAFSAKGETFLWNFSDDVLSGEYQASVIAFGKNGVLTRFSNFKRFKVVRK